MARTPHHPTADSDTELAQARVNAGELLRTVQDAEIDYVLLNACRQMPIGQLAYVLLHPHEKTDDFPTRDHAVATAFIEKYDARVRH